ncbi:MAG TPA: hypothetical protein DCM59_16675 [Clostridium sp.]|nr:hypothetical protein [Clostridium sp.]
MELVKRIPIRLEVFEFKIMFSYETKKGHYREQKRSIKGFNENDAVSRFKKWGKQQRTMFNVKILGIEENFKSRETIEL